LAPPTTALATPDGTPAAAPTAPHYLGLLEISCGQVPLAEGTVDEHYTTCMLCSVNAPFNPVTGYLPMGVHPWEWGDFLVAFAWNGRRRFLGGGLYRALVNLRQARCRAVIVDGSFVSTADDPRDYDAAFDPVGVDGNLVDPVLLKYDDGRKAMRAKYF